MSVEFNLLRAPARDIPENFPLEEELEERVCQLRDKVLCDEAPLLLVGSSERCVSLGDCDAARIPESRAIVHLEALTNPEIFKSELQTIQRLAWLEGVLQRGDHLKAISRVTEFLDCVSSKSVSDFSDLLTELDIISCYRPYLNHGTDLRAVVDLVCSELRFLLMTTPIIPSYRGLNGGVLFLNSQNSNFVLKVTSWWELACHRLYSLFLETLHDPTLHIPEGVKVKEEEQVFPSQIGDEIKSRKQWALLEKGLKNSIVVMFSKVPGASLLDFLSQQYDVLNDQQKQQLFVGMGKIVMLDFLLGHRDRLCSVKFGENGKLVSEDEAANLGNVMIKIWPDGSLHFYLIDNSADVDMDVKLITRFVRRPDLCSKEIVEVMQSQISKCFEQARFPSDQHSEKTQQNFTKFLGDFSVYKEVILSGIQEMQCSLAANVCGDERIAPFKSLRQFDFCNRMGFRRFMDRVMICSRLKPPSDVVTSIHR